MFNNNSAQIVGQSYNTRSANTSNAGQNNNVFQNSSNQYQPNNFIQQNNVQNKQNHSYLQEQEMMTTFNRIYEVAKGDDINKLITIIDKTFEHTDGILKRACREGESIAKDIKKDIREDIKKKYADVRERNILILKAMMNLRQKMMNQMFMYKVREPTK